ncbi:MAG: hypothetical protein Q7J48_08915 [Nocardioides sp.]|nr:hypothetical protein [Nocardioides sp.]
MTTGTTTGTTAPASGARTGSLNAGALPRAGARSGSGAAPLKNNYSQLLQVVLFWMGAILMPTGIIVILLGYYGVANAVFDFDREAYAYSGGFLGLALTFCGGFLYFGAWLARIADDNRAASKRLADTLLVLADVTSRSAALSDKGVDTSALPVVAGNGTTIHRRDCALIAHREDLAPAGDNPNLTACRVCKP